MNLSIRINSITWQQALPVRHKVLWPNEPELFCQVEGEEIAKHCRLLIGEKLVIVASIYLHGDTARLRKFATLVEFQGMGLGTKLISHIIHELQHMAIINFWCDARTTATSFYRKFNMEQQGTTFSKLGVLYVKMSTNTNKC